MVVGDHLYALPDPVEGKKGWKKPIQVGWDNTVVVGALVGVVDSVDGECTADID